MSALSERYERDAKALGGCPLEAHSEGGGVPLLAPVPQLFALLADNELPCGCLPGFPHGRMCTDRQAQVTPLPIPARGEQHRQAA